MDCTGADIEPYLPTLMEIMLSALNYSENPKIKELAVSAIGAIGKNSGRKQKFCLFKYQNSNIYILEGNCGTSLNNFFPAWIELKPFTVISANAAKELMVPYFSPVIESLKGFLTSVTEETRPLQTQSLGRSSLKFSTQK